MPGATTCSACRRAHSRQRHGKREFWRRIARADDFYAGLPLMPDARTLFDAVDASRSDHPHRPAARQLGGAAESPLGRRAFSRHAIITCMARDKYRHMKGTDVLVDDRADHRDKWEAAGGIFVHHKNAREQPRAARRNLSDD